MAFTLAPSNPNSSLLARRHQNFVNKTVFKIVKKIGVAKLLLISIKRMLLKISILIKKKTKQKKKPNKKKKKLNNNNKKINYY